MPELSSTFVDRFYEFYDACSPEEREVLDLMGAAAVLVRDGAIEEPETVGFQTNAGRPFLIQNMMSDLKLMNEMLSNVSKTRSEISMTFARNARA